MTAGDNCFYESAGVSMKAQAPSAASSWRAFCDIERRGQRPK